MDNIVPDQRVSAEELFRAHARFVASFLYRLGLRESDVEDAVQEVFTVAHRKGGFQPGRASASTWLAAIAVRVASTQRRSQRRRRENFDEAGVVPLEGTAPCAEQTLETRQALQRVEQALATLDVSLRAVFVLFELEGASCAEISEALTVPIGTVYSRLHTARQRFEKAHEELVREETSRSRGCESTAQFRGAT